MRIILLLVCLVVLGGCFSLPPGKAPVGPIVEAKEPAKEYSWIGARNYMLTSLSMFCLQNFPQGAKFYADFKTLDMKLKRNSRNVLCAVSGSVPIKLVKKTDADYRVNSEMSKEKIWTMRLIDIKNGKAVWLERVKMSEL
jgi:PBP1b-binding outer membrane lipoprotein LpoB